MRGREQHLWRGSWVVTCSQKYFSLLSLELNQWIIYSSTNLNVKRLGQLETERGKRIFALAPPPSTTPPPPHPPPAILKVCSPDHRHAYFMHGGRELWWKAGGVTVGRSWSVYCPHQRLIIMSACKIAWYYLILLENWNSCRGGWGQIPTRGSWLQSSALSGWQAASLQEDQRSLDLGLAPLFCVLLHFGLFWLNSKSAAEQHGLNSVLITFMWKVRYRDEAEFNKDRIY